VAQLVAQHPLQVGLGERVFERVAEAERAGAPRVDQWPAVAAEVPRTGAGHDDGVHRLVHPGELQGAQRLVVEADRLGVVAGARVAFDQQHGHAERAEQMRRGESGGPGADDEHGRGWLRHRYWTGW
jgi:hypothetical protein